MDYHDWHLSGYSVREYGESITLHLSWDYPNADKKKNDILFSNVAAYHFIHGEGSIITAIDEHPISSYIENESDFIETTASQMGLRYWHRDMAEYLNVLKKNEFRYWEILSAIGFYGFVVAKTIEEK